MYGGLALSFGFVKMHGQTRQKGLLYKMMMMMTVSMKTSIVKN